MKKNFAAYWYKPGKPMIEVSDDLLHVEYILEHPDLFGVPDRLMQLVHAVEDPIDQSNYDRDILVVAARNGWFRIHKYTGSTSIIVYQLVKKTKDTIFDIVRLLNLKESDEILIETENRVNYFGARVIDRMTVKDILSGKLFEGTTRPSSVLWFDSKTEKMVFAKDTRSSHQFVIEDTPWEFGLSKEKVFKLGPADAESKVMKDGWWRVHVYPSFMTVDLSRYDRRAKEKIHSIVLGLGVDPDSNITIRDIRDNYYIDVKASEFLGGEVFESAMNEIQIHDSEFGDSYWYHPDRKKLIRSAGKEATHGSIIYEFPKEFGFSSKTLDKYFGGSGYDLADKLVERGWFRINVTIGNIRIVVPSLTSAARKQAYDVLTLLSPSANYYIYIEDSKRGDRYVVFQWKDVSKLFEGKFRRLIGEII